MQFMCPKNKLGKIDIYIVSHHGWNQSSSPAFVYGIAPRIAIMDNGAKKGGTPSVWDIIEKSPGLETLGGSFIFQKRAAPRTMSRRILSPIQRTPMLGTI